MASTSSASPMRAPKRALGTRYGAPLIDSMPPATTSPAWPSSTYWAAVAMAFSPDRQTLLTVRAGTVMGIPPRTAACLAVICPCPAWRTWPMTTCSTDAGSAPARSRAAATARPPSSTAGSGASAPPNRPMGVLAPAQMTGWVRSNMVVPPSPALLRVYRPVRPPGRVVGAYWRHATGALPGADAPVAAHGREARGQPPGQDRQPAAGAAG